LSWLSLRKSTFRREIYATIYIIIKLLYILWGVLEFKIVNDNHDNDNRDNDRYQATLVYNLLKHVYINALWNNFQRNWCFLSRARAKLCVSHKLSLSLYSVREGPLSDSPEGKRTFLRHRAGEIRFNASRTCVQGTTNEYSLFDPSAKALRYSRSIKIK